MQVVVIIGLANQMVGTAYDPYCTDGGKAVVPPYTSPGGLAMVPYGAVHQQLRSSTRIFLKDYLAGKYVRVYC